MSRKISWTRDWPKQDYTGFSPNQIRNAKHIYKKMAKFIIDAQIKKLRKKIAYRISWNNDNTMYYINTYLTPAAIEIQKGKSKKKGIGGSIVSPPPPPKP